jgi:hypothetical protein
VAVGVQTDSEDQCFSLLFLRLRHKAR